MRRSPPPARRGCFPLRPAAPPLCGTAVGCCVAVLSLKSQNCVPVRSFRQFMGSGCLEQRDLLGKSCAPVRSFLKFMSSWCFGMRQTWTKVGLSCDAFDNLQVLASACGVEIAFPCGAFCDLCVCNAFRYDRCWQKLVSRPMLSTIYRSWALPGCLLGSGISGVAFDNVLIINC